MHYDYLIVGSGLSGSTIANLLKNAGKKVLVLEKRDDVGGNISTAIQDDIIVHTYGPHIFHTSDKFAWDMFNKNVEVYPFINSPWQLAIGLIKFHTGNIKQERIHICAAGL